MQSHLLESADSVIVAPVVRDAAHLLQGIDLAIEVDGERLTVTLVELFSIERELLKKAHAASPTKRTRSGEVSSASSPASDLPIIPPRS